jgi:hypothetical protein
MKNLKKFTSALIIFMVLSLSITSTAFAKKSEQWTFTGTISPKYDFMKGDMPVPSDFNIEGTLSNSDGSIKYQSSDLTLRSTLSADTMDNNTLLKELTSTTESLQLSVYVVSKKDSKVKALTAINIKVTDFSPKASYELDSKTIEVKKAILLKTSFYDTMPQFDNKEYFVFNSNGRKIDGLFTFKNDDIYKIRFGYNNINYHFDSTATKYDDIDGSFIIKYMELPKIVTSKNSILIRLDNSDNRYLFTLDGNEYTYTAITKLKSKTVYKLAIYQNGLEKSLLYETTITTK